MKINVLIYSKQPQEEGIQFESETVEATEDCMAAWRSCLEKNSQSSMDCYNRGIQLYQAKKYNTMNECHVTCDYQPAVGKGKWGTLCFGRCDGRCRQQGDWDADTHTFDPDQDVDKSCYPFCDPAK